MNLLDRSYRLKWLNYVYYWWLKKAKDSCPETIAKFNIRAQPYAQKGAIVFTPKPCTIKSIILATTKPHSHFNHYTLPIANRKKKKNFPATDLNLEPLVTDPL